MDLSSVGRALVVTGIVVVVLGGLLIAGASLGLGRLPGDLAFRRGNVRVYAPIATSILLSLLLTIVLNLMFRR